MAEKNIIGIDLGTTMCAVSKINMMGKSEIVPFSNGERLLPSKIYIGEDKVYVGKDAERNGQADPDNYFELVKRFMDMEYFPELDEKDDPIPGKFRLRNGEKVSTVWLQSLILKHIKEDFESRYGKIDHVIVTVPAHFDEFRRTATQEAAVLAGLPEPGTINEPTAAGLYYASNFPTVEDVNLVFDLGGGTFDVSLIDVSRVGSKTEVKVLSVSVGGHKIGGRDFDLAILGEQSRAYNDERGEPLFEDEADRLLLLERAEEIKKHLSSSAKYTGRLQGSAGNMTFDLERDTFDELIKSYVQEVDIIINNLFSNIQGTDAEISESQVRNIILVGGSSKIPRFFNYITERFGREPLHIENIDEAVVLGASLEALRRAYEAGDLGDQPTKVREGAKNLVVADVATYSYGTVALSDDERTGQQVRQNVIVIPRNTKVPVKVTKTFYLVSDDQEQVLIEITQGESTNLEEVTIIHSGTLDLSLVPTQKGDEVIAEYSYDANQIMKCVFTHKRSNTVYNTAEIKL